MRRSPNSLSPIAILPNTPPPARIFAQPETPTTPLTDDGTNSPTTPATNGAGPVVVELPAPIARRPSSIRGAGTGSGPQLRFSSLLDPGDITPITSPLPSVTSAQADGSSIYTIFGAEGGPSANVGGHRRRSSHTNTSASNGSVTPAAVSGPSIATNGSAVNGGGLGGCVTAAATATATATSVSASLANSASAKSRSRRSSELSQQNSMKSHASVGSGRSQRKRSSQAHIELNGPPLRDRPRCLKSSFLRRKCKEYA
uniref:Uncharacterized protein n=1 Tax=Anopheles farauti TaxID=69004 RepID=A0A182QHK5_9DIPT